jgi:citrate synthase
MKKRFKEIYIPISIAIGPFLCLIFGISLLWGVLLGGAIALVVHLLILQKQKAKS